MTPRCGMQENLDLIGGTEVAAKALALSPLFDPFDFQADDIFLTAF